VVAAPPVTARGCDPGMAGTLVQIKETDKFALMNKQC
jgi:hypothetical protein